MKFRLLAAAAAVAAVGMGFATSASAAPLPAGYTCVGTSNCGTLGPDGDVTSSPQGGDYGYVSTFGATGVGANNNGDLNIGSETNSSVARSPTFAGALGSGLDFYFNYVTSDGTLSFIEYSWVKLIDAGSLAETILFTARTTPDGNTVPGFGLPGLAPGVTLTPATTEIIDGLTTWSPLGGSSGVCFGGIGAGCGQTGWIEMEYTLPVAGNYFLEFGVVNWGDTNLDSGLAFDGITIDGKPIDPTVPEPATLALTGLALAGIAATRRRRQARR